MSKLSDLKNKLSKYSTTRLDDIVGQTKESAHEYFTWDEEYISELKIKGAKVCESPIEKIFSHALINRELSLGAWGKAKPIPLFHKKDINIAKNNRQKSLRYIYVYPQARVGKFRLDFLIRYGVVGLRTEKMIAVECDGRMYHENDDSFTNDRKRDRTLNSKNIRVLRFTGREINEDINKCITELEIVISTTI